MSRSRKKESIIKKKVNWLSFLRKEKKLFALFALFISLILIIGSTFAWSSYSSWVDNHVQTETGRLSVKVVEEFEQNSVLLPNEPVIKKVNVKNNSDKLAIVRVKLEESVALFKMDSEVGTVLKKKKTTGDKEIDGNDVDTWELGHLYNSSLNSKEYFVVEKSLIRQKFQFLDLSKRDELFKQINIGFSSGIKLMPDLSEQSPYWVYEDGYFYYSKVLKSEEITGINLVENVMMTVAQTKEELKNYQKNQLYNLDISAYGIQANVESLKDWQVSPEIQKMFEAEDSFGK